MKLTICGNMSFIDKFEEARDFLENGGHEIIVPEKDPHPSPLPVELKKRLMEKNIANIETSDGILVMNYTRNSLENHIGPNTMMEIGIAFNRGKKIFLLNESPEFCKDELDAIGAEILEGDLSRLTQC